MRVLVYTKVIDRGSAIKFYIEKLGNDTQAKNRIKVLKSDNRIYDLRGTRIMENEIGIMQKFKERCLDFARFTPEASGYINDNYKDYANLNLSKVNGKDLYEFDLTWVKEYTEKIGADLDE